jgi:hypothetical protein
MGHPDNAMQGQQLCTVHAGMVRRVLSEREWFWYWWAI